MNIRYWHLGLTTFLISLCVLFFGSLSRYWLSLICPSHLSVFRSPSSPCLSSCCVISFSPLPFRVTDPVFDSVDPQPWCLQCGFHFCYTFSFLSVSSLAPPAFFSHHIVLFGSLFHFFGSWTICLYFHGFLKSFCLSSASFIAFLLCCFTLLLLHKYHSGLFCLLFVFAWDQFCLSKRSTDKSSSTPPFSAEQHLNDHLRSWTVRLILMDCNGEAALFFILLSGYGGIRDEAESPWERLSLSAFHGHCGISAPGQLGPIGRGRFPLTSLMSPRCCASWNVVGSYFCSAELYVQQVLE